MSPQPILIVDDEPQLRAIVRKTLTVEGYAVLEAGNGLEGMRAKDPARVSRRNLQW